MNNIKTLPVMTVEFFKQKNNIYKVDTSFNDTVEFYDALIMMRAGISGFIETLKKLGRSRDMTEEQIEHLLLFNDSYDEDIDWDDGENI